MSDRIRATYLLETGYPLDRAAAVIAGEQSSGTFVAVPGETAELRERSGARVERIDAAGGRPPPRRCPAPATTAAGAGDAGEIELSWPLENFGPSLPNLLATVAGQPVRTARGLRPAPARPASCPPRSPPPTPGPQFGIAGTRRLAGVAAGPLIGTIIKPSVGLSPEDTAALVRTLCDGGIDFIKDDELQADGPHCPFDARVRAVMRVVRDHAERTGKKVMVAFNITGELDEMRRRHDLVRGRGRHLRDGQPQQRRPRPACPRCARHADCPSTATATAGACCRAIRCSAGRYVPWQKLWRLAGADHLHVNGLRNKFSEADDSVIASARAVLAPAVPRRAVRRHAGVLLRPVGGAGARTPVPRLGSTDLIYAAGGGIMAHPGGVAAGVASLRQAWEAAAAGMPPQPLTPAPIANCARRWQHYGA